MADGTGDEWSCEGLKSVNDRRGPAGDVAEGVCDAGGGFKAVVPADASVVDAEEGVADENELVAAEDVVEPVGIPKGVAVSANALAEAVVGVKAPVVAAGVV
ncbi:uncharacterized protein IUM83_10695 [Phytophthora cinnamomi]|uniref:uncharacterized protein n=1 Tax=Phytophthora cinnamomi TaxID=4785 RepID=UPI0035596EA7|nr:hypothetical protein IUM83_10695 [Phytophthora cinnamomi]